MSSSSSVITADARRHSHSPEGFHAVIIMSTVYRPMPSRDPKEPGHVKELTSLIRTRASSLVSSGSKADPKMPSTTHKQPTFNAELWGFAQPQFRHGVALGQPVIADLLTHTDLRITEVRREEFNKYALCAHQLGRDLHELMMQEYPRHTDQHGVDASTAKYWQGQARSMLDQIKAQKLGHESRKPITRFGPKDAQRAFHTKAALASVSLICDDYRSPSQIQALEESGAYPLYQNPIIFVVQERKSPSTSRPALHRIDTQGALDTFIATSASGESEHSTVSSHYSPALSALFGLNPSDSWLLQERRALKTPHPADVEWSRAFENRPDGARLREVTDTFEIDGLEDRTEKRGMAVGGVGGDTSKHPSSGSEGYQLDDNEMDLVSSLGGLSVSQTP